MWMKMSCEKEKFELSSKEDETSHGFLKFRRSNVYSLKAYE